MLINIPIEVTLSVFKHLDITSILNIEKTCKYLNICYHVNKELTFQHILRNYGFYKFPELKLLEYIIKQMVKQCAIKQCVDFFYNQYSDLCFLYNTGEKQIINFFVLNQDHIFLPAKGHNKFPCFDNNTPNELNSILHMSFKIGHTQVIKYLESANWSIQRCCHLAHYIHNIEDWALSSIEYVLSNRNLDEDVRIIVLAYCREKKYTWAWEIYSRSNNQGNKFVIKCDNWVFICCITFDCLDVLKYLMSYSDNIEFTCNMIINNVRNIPEPIVYYLHTLILK